MIVQIQNELSTTGAEGKTQAAIYAHVKRTDDIVQEIIQGDIR